jgi:hypothetical protein
VHATLPLVDLNVPLGHALALKLTADAGNFLAFEDVKKIMEREEAPALTDVTPFCVEPTYEDTGGIII